MVAILGYSRDQIFAAVQDMYTAVARNPDDHFHFPTGRAAAVAVGYAAEQVDRLPDAVRASFAGVGNPFTAGTIRPGDTVVDVGAGSGNDTLIAADLVGPEGHAVALDLTAAMTGKLRENANVTGLGQVDVVRGSAERLPLASASVDVVTSNGALNLVPDKRAAVREMFRVLRPGGRLQIADIVIDRPVTVDCHTDPRLWVECVVGATVDEDFIHLFRDAGFEDIEIQRTLDYFALSPSPQTREIAGSFGARSIAVSMRRGETAPSRLRQWLRRLAPPRLLANLWRRGFMGVLAVALTVLTCYGTLIAVGLLTMLGASRTLDEGVWAGAIAMFTALSVGAIATGMRFHHAPGPTALALVGAAAVFYALFVHYAFLLELAGFAVLAIGVWRDIVLRRRQEARVLGLNAVGERAAVDRAP